MGNLLLLSEGRLLIGGVYTDSSAVAAAWPSAGVCAAGAHHAAAMILAFAIINNFGKARILKVYHREMAQQAQQRMVRELFATLSTRPDNASALIDAGPWFDTPGARVVYRTYATLHFCVVIDGSESEPAVLPAKGCRCA